MRQLATAMAFIGTSAMSVCPSASEPAAIEGVLGHEIPPALRGNWRRSEPLKQSEDVIELGFDDPVSPHVVIDKPIRCSVAATRKLTATRWYMDLDCFDGPPIALDMNLIGHDQLLIAPRPLGQAMEFRRQRKKSETPASTESVDRFLSYSSGLKPDRDMY
jgi:hypothetical protein